jgi:Acetyltransferase (GNAT) domain
MLSILSVGYPFAPVGPDPMGGAERILGSIDARLVSDAHDSIVLAAAGSRTAGHLVAIPPHTGWIDGRARETAYAADRREIARLCRDQRIDVVHFHGNGFTEYQIELDIELPLIVIYLTGFDPALAQLSPGRLLVARALERAGDDGAFELDFLRGREPYKYEWGAVDRPASIHRAQLMEDRDARDSLDHR